ncbi:hypothetical protein HYV73_04460 [Candidatus Uhrbacteria bacterium]|nr:hypothetical protein [Candidatus Uhrbacteria bacterium]
MNTPHAAQSLEDTLTVWLGEHEGCIKVGTLKPLPPPKECSGFVHNAYLIGQLHIITVVIIIGFLLLMAGIIANALKR